MSLHAQLSPEAQAKLDAEKRNSKISSIIIALLICALLVAILFYIALSPLFKNTEEIVTYNQGNIKEDTITKPEMKNEVEKKPSSPSSSVAKVIAATTPSATAVPVPDEIVTEPSLDLGDAEDFGDGWDNGSGRGASGDGSGFSIHSSMKKRCTPKDRIERLLKEGGQKEYEEQVVKALRWLKKTQTKDGSWTAQARPVAMTGLALLAYLGHCETPHSPEFGETVEKAIVYLIANSKKNDGALATTVTNQQWCYEHPIATYALAEAYTLCKEFKIAIPGLEEAVYAAGNLIIENQNSNGGWAYNYQTSGGHTDSSVVCWQLQALKACKTTKLKFAGLKESAEKGIKYLKTCTEPNGLVQYKPGTDHQGSMTPGGALCFQQWGKGKRAECRNAIKWMDNDTKGASAFSYKTKGNLYKHYYGSQAMINAGGASWSKYNKVTMTNLAENQSKDGSWPKPKGGSHGMKSAHYATCLATLMMEVYYRFLPSSE